MLKVFDAFKVPYVGYRVVIVVVVVSMCIMLVKWAGFNLKVFPLLEFNLIKTTSWGVYFLHFEIIMDFMMLWKSLKNYIYNIVDDVIYLNTSSWLIVVEFNEFNDCETIFILF